MSTALPLYVVRSWWTSQNDTSLMVSRPILFGGLGTSILPLGRFSVGCFCKCILFVDGFYSISLGSVFSVGLVFVVLCSVLGSRYSYVFAGPLFGWVVLQVCVTGGRVYSVELQWVCCFSRSV